MNAAERECNKQLKELRTEWRRWKRAWPDIDLHFDYCLLPCADKCGTCEGCGMTAYRADRMSEIEAKARAIKATYLTATN